MKATLAALCCLVTLAQGASIIKNWHVGWVHNVNPDGLHPRRGIALNGHFPPQPLSVNSNDYVAINFTNSFGDGSPSTLHGHGIYYNNTNYYDGAAGIVQCPVPDGHSFHYELLNSPKSPSSAEKQIGTYWIHGHYKGQYIDGLRLPFIIHNADGETYQYDDDYTVALADWYHHVHADVLKNKYYKPNGTYPTADAGLMYFVHTRANQTAKNLEGFNENATLPFEPGKTYRIRVVNMSAASLFNFWIEGHDMKIIEVDGEDVHPFPVDQLQVSIGQRYSVLVKSHNTTKHNWKIHANLVPEMFDMYKPTDPIKLNLTSTLSYGNPHAKMGAGRGTVDSYELFDDTQLEPVKKIPMVKPDMSVNRIATMPSYSDNIHRGTFDNKTFVAPLTPTLLTMMSESTSYIMNPATYGPNTNAVVAPHLQMIELVMINFSDDMHPMHMHGSKFQVVNRATDLRSKDPKANPPIKEGQKNPMRRDTVVLPPGGAVTIRFRADNPGAWFLHCHMNFHLDVGMAMVVVQAPNMAAKRFDIPSYVKEQCKMQHMPVSGNAGGIPHSSINFGNLTKAPLPEP
ncbi:hypothetical protein MCAP1_002479 [Malassezia caprae]|uniref:Laccase n=1 Tax=Malassezia caprae TaxID=1381934 RepID=A0AAF0E7G6_9BASI|nr:hypothetical protein MCAP1_002479 [Malassezia caprae]